MNNQEIISRAISYNNSEINAVKSKTNVLSKNLQEKEDKIIELNTDALAGLELPENVTYPEISTDRLLDLFVFDSIGALYNAMSKLDNKIFALKPTLESFKVGNTSYTITNCIPCVGKMIPYGDARVFMLTFIFNTINSYMRTMTLFIDGNSMTDVKGRISIEELSSGSSSELPDDISDTITTLQGEVDTLKETSVTKTSLDTTLGGYSTTGHTHSEYLTEHQDISGKQDVISDLATIRSGAAKGATALQSVPAEYITETELNGKGYATSSYVNGELAKKSDSGHTHSEYLTETEMNNKGYLTSHQSIKTVNGTSLVGSGDVKVGYRPLQTSTSSSMTLTPNVYHRNTSTSLSSLTITLGSITDNTILNEYFVEFTTRSAGTTVNLPSGIKWPNGEAPTFEPSTTYQISIVNNLGVMTAFK